MCLFRLFKNKKNKDPYLTMMAKRLENLNTELQKDINNSFNYQFVFRVVRNTFFTLDFNALYKNDKVLTEYLKFCANAVVNETGLQMDTRFFNLKYYYGKNDNGDKSIIIEFEGPWTVSGECNYMALYKPANAESCIYTSELRVRNNTFCLVKEMRHNERLWSQLEITDLHSFLKLIDQKL